MGVMVLTIVGPTVGSVLAGTLFSMAGPGDIKEDRIRAASQISRAGHGSAVCQLCSSWYGGRRTNNGEPVRHCGPRSRSTPVGDICRIVELEGPVTGPGPGAAQINDFSWGSRSCGAAVLLPQLDCAATIRSFDKEA